MEKSILEMVGGERHIKPHYDIKIIALENTKLKETVACLREDIDVKRKDIDWYKKRGAELDCMLTDKIREVKKAKEIIKELLDFDFLPENEIKKQAEQFLEEVKE